jgi:hypothetical protein
MASDSADGNGVPLAPRDLVVDLADVLGFPSRVMPMAHHHVGGFDECPLKVLVARLAHVTETGLTAAGVDGGDEAGVAGVS